jgi:hypothetical protein
LKPEWWGALLAQQKKCQGKLNVISDNNNNNNNNNKSKGKVVPVLN